MGKLFEALRRLIVASIYVGGVILCGMAISILLGEAANNTEAWTKLSLVIVCTLIAMPALHKLIN